MSHRIETKPAPLAQGPEESPPPLQRNQEQKPILSGAASFCPLILLPIPVPSQPLPIHLALPNRATSGKHQEKHHWKTKSLSPGLSRAEVPCAHPTHVRGCIPRPQTHISGTHTGYTTRVPGSSILQLASSCTPAHKHTHTHVHTSFYPAHASQQDWK